MVLKKVLVLSVILVVVMAMVPIAMAEEQNKIDLNSASVDDLMTLKGIGAKYAQRIVEYRESNGPFTQIDDIMNIKGIGAKTFESIKDMIMIKSPDE
jgi:competence protein ComEA